MKIFVVNCGSSSIKYQLFDMSDESVLAKGMVERIGSDDAILHHARGGETIEKSANAPDHGKAIKVIIDTLVDPEIGVIATVNEITAVGHRVVHGAESATGSERIDNRILDIIRSNIDLAPLHNPPNLAGIEGAMQAMPDIPHVAVFDTAFLSTLPPTAHRYAVPNEWYHKYHVRKYGFHGTSHKYVTLRAAEIFDKPVDEINLITVHLGNGCSMTAIAGGKAVDHSMGLTPLEGLMMGTRSGDIDPTIVLYMISHALSVEEVDHALNKGSGLLGVSGLSNDMRDLLKAIDEGNADAELAVDMFVYRIVKYIGAYYAILPDLDAVILTGGIGENAIDSRQRICNALGRLGVTLDEQKNEATVGGKCGPITTDNSKLPVWVVPTNEELMIARDTVEIVKRQD